MDEGKAIGAVSPAELTVERITDALRGVTYPGLTRDIVSFGMLDRVSVCDGRVKVRLALRATDPAAKALLELRVTRAVQDTGASSVIVEVVAPTPRTDALPTTAARAPTDPWADQVRLSRVTHVIAVGAGKGGVGKSTVALNLALALSRGGLRIGVLDADIYGPSLPILLGVEDGAQRVRMSADKNILPLEAYGLSIISFGFFLGEGSPAIWRGPMVSKAVKQFARGVAWPTLDILVVDLPPGTGDIPLSLAQAVSLSGAVVVTQPPRVAAAEALKAVEMFKSLSVPVLGVVENMTGAFGNGSGREIAKRLEVPHLGQIPFDTNVVVDGDAGVPTMVARPGSDVGLAFESIAHGVAEALGWARVDAIPAEARAS